MQRILRFLSIVALVASSLLVARPAAAATLIATTIEGWQGQSVTIGDKTFSYLGSSGFASTQALEFLMIPNPSQPTNFGEATYIMQLQDLHLLTSPGTYTIDYSITINSPYEQYWFDTAALDVDHVADHSVATKDVYSDAAMTASVMTQLVSNDGAPAGPNNISGQLRTIYVHDTLTLDRTGAVLSMSNTFTQEVPEPASLAIFGGVAGLGLLFRRRRSS